MPIDRDDDAEISAMLSQAEPPKSPGHLDAAILEYAKEKSSTASPTSESSRIFLSLNWWQNNWAPAVATFSIAAIAVSVSLQIFTEPDIGSSANLDGAELALTNSATPRLENSTTAESAQALAQDDPSARARQGVQSRAASLALQAPVQLDATANSGVTAIALDSSQSLVAPSVAAANQPTEEVVVTGAFVRRAVSSASILREEQTLTDALRDDALLQQAVVFVLRSSLGVREQAGVATQQEFYSQVNPLVEAYRQISDPMLLANIRSAYSLAREERQDDRLPELLEELVIVLESLGQ